MTCTRGGMLVRAVLSIALVSIAGCARSIPARGTGWWRVTTEHVRLATDVDHDRAVTAGWAFEDLYRALAEVFPVCRDIPTGDPIEVTMIARGDEYDAIAPGDTVGFYQHERDGIVGVPANVVVRGEVTRGRGHYTQIFVHELTHRFVAACIPGARTWLNEGLAKFFETLRVDDGELVVGIAPYHFAGLTGISRFVADGLEIDEIGRALLRPPSQTVISAPAIFYGPDGLQGTSAYASAWALVHMAMLGGDTALRDAFTTYLTALHAREATSWEDHPERLDDALRAYVAGGHLLARHVPYTPSAHADPPAVAMPEAEAHLLLASFGMYGGADSSQRRDALAHVALALADPAMHATAELVRLEMGDTREDETKQSILDALRATSSDDLNVLVWRGRDALAEPGPTNEVRAALDALDAHGGLHARELRLALLLSLRIEDWVAVAAHRRALAAAAPGHSVAQNPRDTVRAWLAVGDVEAAQREIAFTRVRHDAAEAESETAPADASDDEFDWNFPTPSLAAVVDGPAPSAVALAPSDEGMVFSGDTQPGDDAMLRGSWCGGYVPRVPAAVIDVPPGAAPFVVQLEGDATLVIEAADHRVSCDAGAPHAALMASGSPGPMRIFVASSTQHGGAAYRLIVARAPRAFVGWSSPVACGGAPWPGGVDVGMRVRLRHHEAWRARGGLPDEVRESDWVPAMDAFVGMDAVVMAHASDDAAGCDTVHVDVDGGRWLWRVRDLETP